MRRGQAMLETVIAATVLTFAFLAAFQLSQMLQSRIVLDHAAARAARARAVGFNDFMCLKVARAGMIPVAGRCLWPGTGGGALAEVGRVPLYLESEDAARAGGQLDYERWGATDVRVSSGMGATATADLLMDAGDFRMDGHAEVESHYPLYMEMMRP